MGAWPLDQVAVAQALIACESVTPVEGGALQALEGWLRPLGFACERMPFQAEGTPDVDNLFARVGSPNAGPHLCFAGHTDVVPVGDPADWRDPPFATNGDRRLFHRLVKVRSCRSSTRTWRAP